jgi:hypothetical protein
MLYINRITMKTKKKILCILCLMLTFSIYGQDQEKRNIIGVAAGYCPGRDVWIGNPINIWLDINASPILHLFYTRQVIHSVRLGTYFEYENATIKSTNDKASRYNAGLTWLAQYPDKPLHAQLGGYFGYGFVKADIWDQTVSGIDYGIMIGPAYEKNNFGIAFHLQTGFSYYTSTGTPDEVSYSKGRFLVKIYHKF